MATIINYKLPIDFLKKFSSQDYHKGINLDIKDLGVDATNQMKLFGNLCSNKFNLIMDPFSSNKWLDGSNTKVRSYLWTLLKYEKNKNNPDSISLFVEKGEDGSYRYRVSLEIQENKATPEDYEKHHSFLNTPILEESDLVYFVGSNQTVDLEPTTANAELLIGKLKNKEIRKVQISKIFPEEDVENSNEFEKKLLEAVEELIPYYEDVINGKKLKYQDGGDDTKMKTEEVVFQKIGLNTILYGPPGTGKTFNTKKYAVSICNYNRDLERIKSIDYSDIEKEYAELLNEGRIVFTTFHQSYGYEDFIEGIKPELNEVTNQISYPVAKGVFYSICEEAKKEENNDKPYVLIIDEINRGNISKIFGELITLIEPNKRIGAEESIRVKLPYSKVFFGVPKNVYILGTMNTADRSISLMDTALRRRFDFVEIMPDPSLFNIMGINKVSAEGKEVDVVKMLKTINERIEVLFDREHTIGHGFFVSLIKDPSLTNLSLIFENKVIPLLQEYFYEDYEKIQLVLGDNYKSKDSYKFVIEEENKTNVIFKGFVVEDLIPPKRYRIQKEALQHIESYIEII